MLDSIPFYTLDWEKRRGTEENRMTEQLIVAMAAYNSRDTRRIGHALKVFALAKTIGTLEGLSGRPLDILEVAAVLHDIGIHESEQKYGSSSGAYQQLEGPPVAEKLLREAGADADFTARVCWLIAHHHTYGIDGGADYQCLIEADFLVNIDEDALGREQAGAIGRNYFRTACGRKLLAVMFG